MTTNSRKTPLETPLRPGRNGGQLRSGNPANKGGGRSPDWLEKFCEDALADPQCRKEVEGILRAGKHPAFVAMWKSAADRWKGKPKQTIEIHLTGFSDGKLMMFVLESVLQANCESSQADSIMRQFGAELRRSFA